jgi:hypothetical protein
VVSAANRIVVVRVVDAKTGIMLDVGVFSAAQGVGRTASDLASFVRQCRAVASTKSPKVFLALGSLTDVGVSGRQPDFPDRLRGYLLGAYANSPLTLLEREYVNTLLQEVRLDLAGLADSPTNAPAALQSAFWVVDGFYQSVGTSGTEIELVLNMNRIFGRQTTRTLRGPPQETFFRNVKETVDAVLTHGDPFVLAPTARSEARLQLSIGKELFRAAVGNMDPVIMTSPGYRSVGTGEQDAQCH